MGFFDRYSRRLLAALLAAMTVLAVPAVDARLRATGLLLRSLARADADGGAGLAALGRRPVTEVVEDRAAGGGRMRWYLPRTPAAPPPVLVVHGVHPEGIDEPRLRSFARAMSEAGMVVATPHVASLASFRIDREAVDTIAASARELAERSGRAQVCVLGISFSGGLALIAAGEPGIGDAIGAVVALGAHHDVERIARWYVGQSISGPQGESPPVAPHPYGAGVLLERHLDRFVPAADVPKAQAALEARLLGQSRKADRLLRRLSPEGQQALEGILDRQQDATVGETLLDALAQEAERVRDISPAGRLQRLRVPVYLVHGTGDPVVPSTETLWLAREVPPRALQATMVTPLFRHAELEGEPSLWDQLALVDVIARVLRQTEALPRVAPPALPGRPPVGRPEPSVRADG